MNIIRGKSKDIVDSNLGIAKHRKLDAVERSTVLVILKALEYD